MGCCGFRGSGQGRTAEALRPSLLISAAPMLPSVLPKGVSHEFFVSAYISAQTSRMLAPFGSPWAAAVRTFLIAV